MFFRTNWNGDTIPGYLIHPNKNKAKEKKQNNKGLEQIEWNFKI